MSGHIYIFHKYMYIFCPCHVTCGIFVPRPGVEPVPSAVKVPSPNHWTAREFPHKYLIKLNGPFLDYKEKEIPSLYVNYLYGFVGFHLYVFFVCVLWSLINRMSFLTLWIVSFLRGGTS